jgi:hypothetical protein
VELVEYPLRYSKKNVELASSSTFFLSGVRGARCVWHRGAGAELEKREQSSPKHPLSLLPKAISCHGFIKNSSTGFQTYHFVSKATKNMSSELE